MLMTAYIGSNNVAHRVKKMYVGDSTGKARCMYNPVLKSYNLELSTLNKMLSSGYLTRGASNSSYAVFATEYSNTSVVGYNKNLIKSYASESLTRARYDTMASGNSNWAIFGGGHGRSIHYESLVEGYNNSLVKSSSSLSVARYGGAGATVNDYVLLFGGWGSNQIRNTIDYYTSGFSRGSISGQYSVHGGASGCSFNNYAVFAGGTSGSYSNLITSAFTVNSSLSTSYLTTYLSEGRTDLRSSSNDNYCIISGGENSSRSNVKTADAYNTNFVHSVAPEMNVSRRNHAAISFPNYVIFAAGSNEGIIDSYNKNLVHTNLEFQTNIKDYCTSASIGNNAIISPISNSALDVITMTELYN